MALQDMRGSLAVLEQQGLFCRVGEDVDPKLDVGCMVKLMFQALPERDRFGLLFGWVNRSDLMVSNLSPGWTL